MIPKEKAKELTDKYMDADYTDIGIHGAKQCALICVNEMRNIAIEIFAEMDNDDDSYNDEYLNNVKEEINKL